MREEILRQIGWSVETKEMMAAELVDEIAEAAGLLITCLRDGKKVLACGNGGSAADSQHLAAELVGRFEKERAALPALALTTDTSIITALGNDYGFDTFMARQVEAHGQEGDVLVAISTSGNSPDVVAAAEKALELGMKVLFLGGGKGGALTDAADVAIVIPESNTARIQECHITVIHILCHLIEEELFA